MATVFTHAATAALLSPAAPTGVSPRRLGVALALVAVMPDLDVVAFAFGIPYEHPLGHRGLTHSIPFALLCGALTPWLAGHPWRRGANTAWRIAGLGFLATVSHGVLDAFTDGGLGVGFFVPFSSERFFFPWRPLAVSPISVDAFFSARGLRILASEILWVWLPLAVLLGATAALRARAGRSA